MRPYRLSVGYIKGLKTPGRYGDGRGSHGLSLLGWIAAHLHPPQPTPGEDSQQEQSPKTLADLFAGRVGRIQSGGKERLSEDCGAAFTDYLEEKRKAGHL